MIVSKDLRVVIYYLNLICPFFRNSIYTIKNILYIINKKYHSCIIFFFLAIYLFFLYIKSVSLCSCTFMRICNQLKYQKSVYYVLFVEKIEICVLPVETEIYVSTYICRQH